MAGPSTRDHALYFDSLVDMVPAKHYFEPETEALDLQYLKKADRKAAKRAMRQEGRRNKRLKLDPTAAATSLQIQQQRAARKAQEAQAAEQGAEPRAQGLQPDQPAAGEDLRATSSSRAHCFLTLGPHRAAGNEGGAAPAAAGKDTGALA